MSFAYLLYLSGSSAVIGKFWNESSRDDSVIVALELVLPRKYDSMHFRLFATTALVDVSDSLLPSLVRFVSISHLFILSFPPYKLRELRAFPRSILVVLVADRWSDEPSCI